MISANIRVDVESIKTSLTAPELSEPPEATTESAILNYRCIRNVLNQIKSNVKMKTTLFSRLAF